MASNLVQRSAILPIHFFKIILKTNLKRLKIPKKFTEIYGSDLSNPVFIKPPDGTKWEVYWSKQNGEVWFEKGWKQFTEHYSLDHGCMVVFKFKGGSKFDVLILDRSALEIDYPSCDKNLDQGDDESVQILGESPAYQKARPKPPFSSSRSYKKMKSTTPENVKRNSGQGTKFKKTIKHKPKGEKATQLTLSMNRPREPRAREVSETFITENPFFTIFIYPGDMVRKGVPGLRGYIEEEEKHVILQIGKRTWNVKLLCSNHPPFLHRQFAAGWALFAKESELRPGDVCVFELISKEELIFEVHVYKC